MWSPLQRWTLSTHKTAEVSSKFQIFHTGIHDFLDFGSLGCDRKVFIMLCFVLETDRLRCSVACCIPVLAVLIFFWAASIMASATDTSLKSWFLKAACNFAFASFKMHGIPNFHAILLSSLFLESLSYFGHCAHFLFTTSVIYFAYVFIFLVIYLYAGFSNWKKCSRRKL